MTQISYTIPEAAEQVSVSVSTINRAIRATDPNAFPPPLKAKRIGTEKKPAYRILHSVLEAWANSLPDA
jgi:hypothetical protein